VRTTDLPEGPIGRVPSVRRKTDGNSSERVVSEVLKMKRLIALALLSTSLAFSGVAFAQEDKVVTEADKTVFKKKTIIDFSDVTIQGELTKPEGSYVLNRKKTSFKSLLKIRANFLPELFNSTDNL
jgi:hypothetical protein